jgi:Tfp pilus assembly protein PilF
MFTVTGSNRLAAACAALCLAACSGTPESREAAYMSRGKRYLSAGDFKKASIEFKVASQNMPKDAEPVYQLAMTYLKGGASRQALESLNKAVALNPRHMDAQFQLALFKVGSNRSDLLQQARQILTDRVRQKPADAEALGALALAEAKLGNKEEAQRRLLAFVDNKPANLRPAEFTIAVYMSDADAAGAKGLAKAIAEHVPNSPDAALLQAQVSLATHDPAAADAEVSRALTLKPDFRPALEYRMRRQATN